MTRKLRHLMRGTTQKEALEYFDSLDTVDADFMKGLWKGKELPSGHQMDGILTLVSWYGKRFEDAENVHPLVMYDKKKRLYTVNPEPLLKYAELFSKIKSHIKGNTAQSTSDDFVRHKLVSFPSSCTEILCHTTVCLQNFCTI